MQGSRTHGAHTMWSIACIMAARLYTLLYCMQDARTGAAPGASNGTKARMCVPRAASCDLQEHGTEPHVAGSMEWECSWMRTMYLFSRCRYVFHCSGHGYSAKLIAGNHGALDGTAAPCVPCCKRQCVRQGQAGGRFPDAACMWYLPESTSRRAAEQRGRRITHCTILRMAMQATVADPRLSSTARSIYVGCTCLGKFPVGQQSDTAIVCVPWQADGCFD
jgi:hypothetical protein